MSDDDKNFIRDGITAFLKNKPIIGALTYQQEGRRFASLTDAELRSKFAHVFEQWSHSFYDQQLRKEEDDLEAEFTLRRQEPPFNENKAAVDRLSSAAKTNLDRLKRDDPGRYREICEEIVDDVEKMAIESDDSPKN
jgi:hypothetical protein